MFALTIEFKWAGRPQMQNISRLSVQKQNKQKLKFFLYPSNKTKNTHSTTSNLPRILTINHQKCDKMSLTCSIEFSFFHGLSSTCGRLVSLTNDIHAWKIHHHDHIIAKTKKTTFVVIGLIVSIRIQSSKSLINHDIDRQWSEASIVNEKTSNRRQRLSQFSRDFFSSLFRINATVHLCKIYTCNLCCIVQSSV